MREVVYMSLSFSGLEGTIENGQMLPAEFICRFDGLVIVDSVADVFDVIGTVAESFQGHRYGSVDDLEHAAAGEEFVFDQSDIGLDPGGVAVHHEADGSCGGKDGSLSISESVMGTCVERFVPDVLCGIKDVVRAVYFGDIVDMLPVHGNYV